MIDFSIFWVVSKPIHLSVSLEGKKKTFISKEIFISVPFGSMDSLDYCPLDLKDFFLGGVWWMAMP